MSKVKGFIEIPDLINNAPGEDSQYGELSLRSKTFSREQGKYYGEDTVFRSFHSSNEQGDLIAVPTGVASCVLAIGDLLVSLYTDDQMPTFNDLTELVTYVQSELSSHSPSISNLDFIDKVDVTGGGNDWMPGSVYFTTTEGGNTVEVRAWFVNDLFETQYDEYEIFVAPPTGLSVDELNTTPANIVGVISTNTTSTAVLNKINAITDNARSTYQNLFNITWNDPNETSFTFTTPWVFVGYGPASNNPSAIRDAIRDYIVENTQLSLAVWEIIYPTLFEAMEFYVIPFWDRIAIPEIGPNTGIYSPLLINTSLVNERGTLFAANLSPGQVSAGSELMPALYKSILNVAVGNPNNTSGVVHLSALFTDYCLIPTSHTDFDRMAPATKDFIVGLNEALNIAETATSSSPVPSGYQRTTRQGITYITFTRGGADFLVATKNAVLAGI